MKSDKQFDLDQWLQLLQNEFEKTVIDSFQDFKSEVLAKDIMPEQNAQLGVTAMTSKLVRSVRVNIDRLEEFFKVCLIEQLSGHSRKPGNATAPRANRAEGQNRERGTRHPDQDWQSIRRSEGRNPGVQPEAPGLSPIQTLRQILPGVQQSDSRDRGRAKRGDTR